MSAERPLPSKGGLARGDTHSRSKSIETCFLGLPVATSSKSLVVSCFGSSPKRAGCISKVAFLRSIESSPRGALLRERSGTLADATEPVEERRTRQHKRPSRELDEVGSRCESRLEAASKLESHSERAFESRSEGGRRCHTLRLS
eukprot:6172668-Pleurochrysis_carterae.AAC.1